MTIQSSKLNNLFVSKMSHLKGCSSLAQCYTCGSCSSVCPVGKVVPGFDPRKIVHMVTLGLEKQLLSSNMIWACSQCQSCVEVCPQGVRCSDVIKALRDEALKQGLVDEDRMVNLGLLAKVDPEKCVACLTCVRLCPFGAPYIADTERAYIEPEFCRGCGICIAECPAGAITLVPSLEQRGLSELCEWVTG